MKTENVGRVAVPFVENHISSSNENTAKRKERLCLAVLIKADDPKGPGPIECGMRIFANKDIYRGVRCRPAGRITWHFISIPCIGNRQYRKQSEFMPHRERSSDEPRTLIRLLN